jgi:PPOX class probable F420-dependent enzyme
MKALRYARYINFATRRKNGNEVRTPVWFAANNTNTLYCFSAANAGKVKRLRHSNRSRIATCDARGGNLGDWVDSRAYLVSDTQEIDQAYQLLKHKYGLQMTITNLFSWLSGRINNREVIRIELESIDEE